MPRDPAEMRRNELETYVHYITISTQYRKRKKRMKKKTIKRERKWEEER